MPQPSIYRTATYKGGFACGAAYPGIAQETRVVWQPDFDPASVEYVREHIFVGLPKRRATGWIGVYPNERKSTKATYRVAGWTEVDAPTTGFVRRVFWLAAHDPYPGGLTHPSEAVLTASIRPGCRGTSPRAVMRLRAEQLDRLGC